MMSLQLSALSAALLSPSRNPCMVRLPQPNGGSHYRINPYNATVLPPIEISPQFAAMAPAAAARRPRVAVVPPPMAPPLTTSVLSQAIKLMRPTESVAAPVMAPIAPAAARPAAAAAAVISEEPAKAAAEATADRTRYAVVKFKHDFVWFLAPFKVSVGDIVAVEGDRGENIGTVEEITTEKPEYPITQRVIRHAHQKDKDHVSMLRRKEAAATKTCQDVAESVGLNIRVVDTEFQYDMNKLTVFFASKVPVDFRKFQRELFREFRCRIWIVNWPRKPHH